MANCWPRSSVRPVSDTTINTWHARCALLLLWISQVARITADNCLRIFVVLQLASVGEAERATAWHLVAALFVFPSIFFAPLNGALSNSLQKRRVLIGAAAFCLSVVVLVAVIQGNWLWGLGLVAAGNALYSPARYGMLPAAAHDTRWPLTRVNGVIEMGSVSAIVAGIVLGGYLHNVSWAQLTEWLDFENLTSAWIDPVSRLGLPTIAVVLALNVIGLLTALPVSFPSDVHRPEPAGQALLGFFRDSVRVFREPESCACLLAMAGFRGLVLIVPGAVLASTDDYESLTHIALLIVAGSAAGSLLAGVQGHPTRTLGQVPFGATGLTVAIIVAALLHPVPDWLCLLMGILGGLINVPLFATYQASLPADARGNGIAILNTFGYMAMTIMSAAMFGLARSELVPPAGQLWLVAGLALLGTGIAWWALLRDSYEQIVELLFFPMYRVRAQGPGVDEIPRTGPLLVVANHSAWLDPFFLGKVLPRRMIGMLTSHFFDVPFLNFLARHVVHAIRVADCKYRREAPELDEAIAALDRGECVLIFPEGQMRKKAEQPLRPFGRGVWHILHARPQTPVVICWIEGAWGSFTSYYGGKPATHKRPDFWRLIRVAVTAPRLLGASLLEEHRATRTYLMMECLDARRHLGLEPLEAPSSKEEIAGKELK